MAAGVGPSLRVADRVTGEDLNQSALEDTEAPAQRPAARGVARNTVIFSIATGLSRIAGLVREIVASSYFATSGAFSAFTIAFQVPNLVRSLFADAALSAAFVPVFTEMLEQGRRREAFRLASTLFFLILAVLGTVTVLFILAANVVMPAFTGGEFTAHLDHLTSGLSRVLFRSWCCSASTASWSGSSTPTTTSASRRSARWCGTS